MAKSGWKKGRDLLAKNYDKKVVAQLARLRKFSPGFVDMIYEYGFGNVWQRPLLSEREKEIAVLASLISQGCVEEQFRGHVQAAQTRGITIDEIKEIIILMGLYIGTPRCLKAILILQEESEKRKR